MRKGSGRRGIGTGRGTEGRSTLSWSRRVPSWTGITGRSDTARQILTGLGSISFERRECGGTRFGTRVPPSFLLSPHANSLSRRRETAPGGRRRSCSGRVAERAGASISGTGIISRTCKRRGPPLASCMYVQTWLRSGGSSGSPERSASSSSWTSYSTVPLGARCAWACSNDEPADSESTSANRASRFSMAVASSAENGNASRNTNIPAWEVCVSSRQYHWFPALPSAPSWGEHFMTCGRSSLT